MDAAAAKHGKKIAWTEVLAGEKAFNATGSWLPDETVESFREHLIGIKGPLTTPVVGGIRSLNVARRTENGQRSETAPRPTICSTSAMSLDEGRTRICDETSAFTRNRLRRCWSRC